MLNWQQLACFVCDDSEVCESEAFLMCPSPILASFLTAAIQRLAIHLSGRLDRLYLSNENLSEQFRGTAVGRVLLECHGVAGVALLMLRSRGMSQYLLLKRGGPHIGLG